MAVVTLLGAGVDELKHYVDLASARRKEIPAPEWPDTWWKFLSADDQARVAELCAGLFAQDVARG